MLGTVDLLERKLNGTLEFCIRVVASGTMTSCRNTLRGPMSLPVGVQPSRYRYNLETAEVGDIGLTLDPYASSTSYDNYHRLVPPA